jgi:adiponectin receptor
MTSSPGSSALSHATRVRRFRASSQSQSPSPRALLSWRELPAWMRDNPFIETQYRAPLPSVRTCLVTAFTSLHNESVNVWTHALGLVLFLSLLASHVYPVLRSPSAPSASAAAFALLAHFRQFGLPESLSSVSGFAAAHLLHAEHARIITPLLVSAVYCMLMSTLMHACWVRSPRALAVLTRLDFCGIALLIAGHTISGVRVAFYCHPRAQDLLSPARIYAGLSASAAIMTARQVIRPEPQGPAADIAHVKRAITFIALGGTGLVPVLHAGYIHGWADMEFRAILTNLSIVMALYLAAGLFYASRVPECCRPGKHDLFCSSHQIMHTLVVIALSTHYRGIKVQLDYRLSVGCSLSPF